MVITLLGDTVVKPGKEEHDAQLSAKLEPILVRCPAFRHTRATGVDDGEEMGLIREYTWESGSRTDRALTSLFV
jgi:hypothetical protein